MTDGPSLRDRDDCSGPSRKYYREEEAGLGLLTYAIRMRNQSLLPGAEAGHDPWEHWDWIRQGRGGERLGRISEPPADHSEVATMKQSARRQDLFSIFDLNQ